MTLHAKHWQKIGEVGPVVMEMAMSPVVARLGHMRLLVDGTERWQSRQGDVGDMASQALAFILKTPGVCEALQDRQPTAPRLPSFERSRIPCGTSGASCDRHCTHGIPDTRREGKLMPALLWCCRCSNLVPRPIGLEAEEKTHGVFIPMLTPPLGDHRANPCTCGYPHLGPLQHRESCPLGS